MVATTWKSWWLEKPKKNKREKGITHILMKKIFFPIYLQEADKKKKKRRPAQKLFNVEEIK